jgi:hypothetical protein
MIDWNALLQAIVASGAVAGAVFFVFKKYTEKRIEHVFDRKLKEYEARLQEATALRIGIGKDRVEEYKRLSAMVMSVRKHAVNLYEMSNPTPDGISTLMSEAQDLENLIYGLSITLHLDRIYDRVHAYKVELKTLINNLENERKLRNKGQTERADGVRGIIASAIKDIQNECKSIVDLLVSLISPKSTP